MLKAPPKKLGELRNRAIKLMERKLTRKSDNKLDERSEQLLSDVCKLVLELVDLRFANPDFAEPIMRLETQLLNAFPEADKVLNDTNL